MNELMIGEWIIRETDDGLPLTKPHYVESIVAEEPFTNCGRRLRLRAGTRFRVVPIPPLLDQCQQCRTVPDPVEVLEETAAEEDATTVVDEDLANDEVPADV